MESCFEIPVMTGKNNRTPLEQIFQTGWHVGVNYGVGFQVYDDPDHHWFYGYNICTGEQELYNMSESDPVNLFHDRKYADVRNGIIRKFGGFLKNDPRWLGYWSTYRLHNAEILPKSEEDMQMFVPKK